MGFFDNLVTEEIKQEVETAQKVSTGGLLAPGTYLMAIDKAYASKAQSGAIKVTIEFKYKKEDGEDGKFFWSGYVQSGDEKGNKSYWTDKNGKKHPLPDLTFYKQICESAGVPNPQTKDATMEMFGEQVQVKAMPELTGKQVIVGVRHKYDDFRDKDVAFVDTVLDKDGKNTAGEDLLEKLKEKIEKTPYVKPKEKKEAKKEEPKAEEKSPW
jgi:hypothetical protein